MKKIILTIFLLAFYTVSFSQEKNDKITIEFNNVNLKTALEKIEQTTGYKFYFDQNWFADETNLITKSYTDVSLNDLLESLFEKTALNFYIIDKKIILSKNSTIHSSLPENYFSVSENAQTNQNTAKPVFHQQYDTLVRNSSPAGIIYIGKEKKGGEQKMYVLSGFIKNIKTKNELSNATIRVRDKNISTVANNDGSYKITIPYGLNYIDVELVNHKKTTETIMVYDNGNLDIFLHESINELDEVVIKKNADKNVKDVIAGVSTYRC